jgi:hypothetical protein
MLVLAPPLSSPAKGHATSTREKAHHACRRAQPDEGTVRNVRWTTLRSEEHDMNATRCDIYVQTAGARWRR